MVPATIPKADVPTCLERNRNGILPVSLREVVMPPFFVPNMSDLLKGVTRGVTERGYMFLREGLQKWVLSYTNSLGGIMTVFKKWNKKTRLYPSPLKLPYFCEKPL